MPTTSRYEVRVGFDRTDRQTGETTRYEPGDTYAGEDIQVYLSGVDDQGPLIVEKNPGPRSDIVVKEN
jgi:hypothetical protein